MKKIAPALLAVLLLLGCEKKEQSEPKTVAKVATAQDIEIAQNDNPQEIKVRKHSEQVQANESFYIDTPTETQDESQRARTALDANLHVRSPYEKVQISMLIKGLSENYIVKCSACHNDYANGLIGPSLLGKSKEHIKAKIVKFRGDKSVNVLMSDLVAKMSDKEIADLADEIYNFNAQIKKIRG